MATAAQAGRVEAARRPKIMERPASSSRFDALVAGLATVFLFGIFLDGWAHNTYRDLIETFFTPWHAALYGGFAVTGAVVGIAFLRNVLRGHSWRNALPRGYAGSLLGAILFAIGGGFDFAWHSLFGFEVSTEALLSPAHLWLASGAILLMSGPLRSAWLRSRTEERGGWGGLLPALLSLFAVMSLATFFAQYSNAFQHANTLVGSLPPEEHNTYYVDTAAVSYFLIPSAIVMGVVLLAMRRWTLPTGSLTLLITGNAALMFWMGSRYTGEQWIVLAAALAGGVIADVLYAALKPSAERLWQMRVFAFGVPFLMYFLYLTVLILTDGIWWSLHMWSGVPFLAGAVGLGMSLLAFPPPAAAE